MTCIMVTKNDERSKKVHGENRLIYRKEQAGLVTWLRPAESGFNICFNIRSILLNDVDCWGGKTVLRTVPTIVIAHTFCASPYTRISYRRCLLIQGYFCAV